MKKPRDALRKVCVVLALLLSLLSVSVFAETQEVSENTDLTTNSGLEVLTVTDAADLLPNSELRQKMETTAYEVHMTCDIEFTPEQSVQMTSIKLADGTWFDGCGYSISGWNYTGAVDWYNFGVFRGTGKDGLMQNVKICNLSIIDCTFVFTEAAANGTSGIVCPLVGKGCNFYNIYTNAIVRSDGTRRSCSMFGTIGNGAQAVVEYCQFDGEINCADTVSAFFHGIWGNDSLSMSDCLMTGLLVQKGQQVKRGVFVAQMSSSVTFQMNECYSIYGSFVPLWGSASNIVGTNNAELSRAEMIDVAFLERMQLDLAMYGPAVDMPPILRIASGKGTVREIDAYLDVQAMSHVPYTGSTVYRTETAEDDFDDLSSDVVRKAIGILALVALGAIAFSVFSPKKTHRRKMK